MAAPDQFRGCPGHPRLPGLSPKKDVDARDKRGHDDGEDDSTRAKFAVVKRKSATRRVTTWLHPGVHAAVIGLVLWFVVWVWSFAGAGVTDYLLFIVSGFIFIAVSLPLILSRVGCTHGDAAKGDDKPASFRDWARWDFDTWQGPLTGTQAAMQILLPIAAAAFGMMALGIVFRVIEHGM
jgi:hypothetical protein